MRACCRRRPVQASWGHHVRSVAPFSSSTYGTGGRVLHATACIRACKSYLLKLIELTRTTGPVGGRWSPTAGTDAPSIVGFFDCFRVISIFRKGIGRRPRARSLCASLSFGREANRPQISFRLPLTNRTRPAPNLSYNGCEGSRYNNDMRPLKDSN